MLLPYVANFFALLTYCNALLKEGFIINVSCSSWHQLRCPPPHSPPLGPKPARFLWSEAMTLLTGARGLASFLIWVGSRLNMATFFTFLMGGGAVLPSSLATLSTLSSSGSVETSQSWTLSHIPAGQMVVCLPSLDQRRRVEL